jgi:hypothetical protein
MFFNKKLNSYTVVEAKDRFVLVDKVNERLNDNWVCIGGVQHIQTKTGGNQYDYKTIDSWVQAMGHKAT